MRFNPHSNLVGTHAFLSASSSAWVDYDEAKLEKKFITATAARRGTELHAWACESIKLNRKQPEDHDSVSAYINDAIGYRMTPEQILFYSINCYGTPDAISFRKNFLRIHDLKTGVILTSERQLKVYAALFCLEYNYKPHQLAGIELRIYQSDDIRIYDADPDDIVHIMDKIVSFDKCIEILREEAE